MWPLSLLALKCCTMALSVPRNSKSHCKIIPPVSEGRMLRETQCPRKFISHLHSAYKTEQYMDLETSKCELNADHKSEIVSKITKVYMKGVKLKKQHEIKQMAQVYMHYFYIFCCYFEVSQLNLCNICRLQQKQLQS